MYGPGPTKLCGKPIVGPMETPRITETECIDNGVLVTFDSDITALFSASFMFAHLNEAIEVCDTKVA
jgi:hypothetical protein